MSKIESLMRELDVSEDMIALVLSKVNAAGDLGHAIPRMVLGGNGDGDA